MNLVMDRQQSELQQPTQPPIIRRKTTNNSSLNKHKEQLNQTFGAHALPEKKASLFQNNDSPSNSKEQVQSPDLAMFNKLVGENSAAKEVKAAGASAMSESQDPDSEYTYLTVSGMTANQTPHTSN